MANSPHKNSVLISSEQRLTGETAHRKADDATVAKYRDHCRSLTRGTVLPPVLYKGRTLPAGELGEREFSE